MKIINYYSPNFNKRKRLNKSIKAIIIHYTGMQSERESIKRLCDPKIKVSCHFVINRKGKIYKLVNEDQIAWHAGKSRWNGYKNLNKISIGIELVNKGHNFGYTNFSKKQIFNLIKLSKKLIKKYKIQRRNVVGHSDIAPLRKKDPGEKFPWETLAQKKVGIWHDYKKNFLIKLRKNKIFQSEKKIFVKNLTIIGYCFNFNKKSDLIKIVKAFQRHFRSELVNGLIDKECLVISQSLVKNAKKT